MLRPVWQVSNQSLSCTEGGGNDFYNVKRFYDKI